MKADVHGLVESIVYEVKQWLPVAQQATVLWKIRNEALDTQT
jgi:hypothetical protein